MRNLSQAMALNSTLDGDQLGFIHFQKSGEWDVWSLWMLQRAFVVWPLPQLTQLPRL